VGQNWTPIDTATTGTKSAPLASADSPPVCGAGKTMRPSFAALIQFQRCCGTRSWRRATSAITPPGAIASATIRPFSSSFQRRRRTTPVTSARRRTILVSSLMSTIMCTRPAIPRESPACKRVAHSATCGQNTAYERKGRKRICSAYRNRATSRLYRFRCGRHRGSWSSLASA
jgi:hypothetical protein